MSDPVLARVSEVIRETFGHESLTVMRETVAEDVPGWDSLSHTILMLSIDDAFHIVLPAGLREFSNVGELVDAIKRVLVP